MVGVMDNVLEVNWGGVKDDLLDMLVEQGIIKFDGQISEYRWTTNNNVIDDISNLPYDFGMWVQKDFKAWLEAKELEFTKVLNEKQTHVKPRKYTPWKQGSRKH
jgi:hypothetical protein